MSSTAAYPDQTLYYSESDTFVTSPFGSYGDSIDHVSRNSLPLVFQAPNGNPVLDANNTQGSATFKITICEPLIMSPLVFDKHWYRRPGFTLINNIIINMTIDPAAIQRIWRQSTGDLVTYNNVQVSFDQPSLLLYYKTLPTYITPPNTLSYPFASIQNFIYQYSNQITPAQPTFQLTTNTVQFQTIPHRILICVTKSRQQLTYNDADAFVPITNINITWDNKSGVLSTLTQYDLYQICVKNGLKMSWGNFSEQEIRLFNQQINKSFHGTSAPIALDFGTDIALLKEDFPGKKGTWNFQITVSCVNNRTENQWLPQVDLIVIYAGKIDIINATVNQSVGIEPGAAFTSLGKVSYPVDVDIYSGGMFDLGTLLAAIPGRLIKNVANLVSSLFGSEEKPSTGFTAAYTPTQPQTPARKEITIEDLNPSLIRQLKKLLRNTE
jgi:hypothetical protein